MQSETTALIERLHHALVRQHDIDNVSAGQWVHAYASKVLKDDPTALDTLTRTVADQATSDNVGVVPVPIIGDLLKFVDSRRPVINSGRHLAMPALGSTFTRPRVTQTTSVGAQASQHAELSSQKMTIAGDTVTKGTYGGVLDISEQDIDWTDPAMLQVAIEDLAAQYAVTTEDAAATAVEAKVTSNNTDLSATATAAQFQAGLATAAGSVYGTAKALPDTLYAAVDRWAYLLGLVDTTGRPVFPAIGVANAPGSLDATGFAGSAAGLRLVVSPAFTTGFLAVGVSHHVEFYETPKGVVQVPSPDTLSLRVAFRGYFAPNVYAQGLWGLVDTA